MALLPLDEARGYVLDRVERFGPATVPLSDALGLVTAGSVAAASPVPPFDNTALDGYAVRADDTAGAEGDRPVRLRVSATIAAGAVPERPVETGEAVRIMTGAPMPAGADAIVMVEDTAAVGDAEVDIRRAAKTGDGIRRAGSDLPARSEAIAAGTALGPAHLGVLASVGCAEVEVYRRPRVGVLSTGDELVEPGRPLGPGQIYESNRWALIARLAQVGGDGFDLGAAPDDPAEIEARLRRGIEGADAVLTSGGVSMGDYDEVKVVLDRIGEMRWMQLAIKPAKPFAFGIVAAHDDRRVPVFGLPGNPVSSLVSFELLARPALRRMAGHEPAVVAPVPGVAAEDFRRRQDGKTHFVRVVTEWDGDGRLAARSVGGQGSHQLAATARADALAVLPDGPGVAAGERLDVLSLR